VPEISTPELSSALRRRFEIVGEGVIDTLSPEIVGVVILDDLATAEPFRRAIGGTSQSNVAGQYSQIQLRNPVGSGTVLLVEQIVMAQTAVAITVYLSVLEQSNFGTVVTPAWADTRLLGRPTGQLGRQASAALLSNLVVGSPFMVRRVPGDNAYLTGVGITLMPGWAAMLETSAVNEPLIGSFIWSERALKQEDT